MKREVGDKGFPIWLLGDSNPRNWQHVLETPLDSRHPVRHNIWTSVLETIQNRVYRAIRGRLETSSIYIRNAVADPADKPARTSVTWGAPVANEVGAFQQLLNEYQPPMVLTFGAFAFEFARRALGEKPMRAYNYWGSRRLGNEFRVRTRQLGLHAITPLPLLHRVISGGRFIQAHEYYCDRTGANYFRYVGDYIARWLLEHRDDLPVWVV